MRMIKVTDWNYISKEPIEIWMNLDAIVSIKNKPYEERYYVSLQSGGLNLNKTDADRVAAALGIKLD